jgi:tetratricopeptide (TPR) repeat protein
VIRTRSARSCLTLVILASLLAACGGAQSRFAAHMQRGQNYFASGDFAKANVEFRNAMQISPRNTDAALMAGRTAEKLGRVRDAAGLYQYVVDNAPDNLAARANLGRLLVLGGAPERALTLVQPALARHPDDVGLLTVRAFARLSLKQPDRPGALADVEHALRVAPASEEAVALRARMYADAGEFTAGAALVNAALRQHPDSTDMREILAGLYNAAGEPLKAEEQLRALVRLKPGEPRFRYALAQFYLTEHRTDDAQRVLEEAVRDLKSDDTRVRLVAFLTTERGAAQGEQALRDFIAHDPGNNDLRLALGTLLQQAGNSKAAVTVYDEVVRRDGTGPKGLIARDRLAGMALTEGRNDDARRLIEQVLAENAHDNDALAMRGQIEFGHGDLTAAIADFRAVLRDQPRASAVYRLLARAYVANDQLALAEEQLRKGIEIAPADTTLLLELARLQVQNGQAAEAVALLEPAVTNAPTDALLHEALVRAYLGKGDYAAAYAGAEALQAQRPDASTGFYLAGLAAQGLNKPDDAQRQLTHALALQPRAIDALTALSQLEVTRGKTDQAVKLLTDAFERDKTNAFPLNLLGEVYLEVRNVSKASEVLTHATEVAPKWWPPYRNLAIAREVSGDTAAASSAYQTAIRIAPAEQKLPIELALLYEKHGRVDDAIACYDAWLKQTPRAAAVANNLAVLLVTYRKDAASLDRARDLTAAFASSNDGRLLDTSGWVRVKRAEYTQALPVLERAAERVPDSREIRYHLAIAELHAGQTERARSNLESALSGAANFAGADEARSTLAALKNHAAG